MRVGILEGPAARPDIRAPVSPVAFHIKNLSWLQPLKALERAFALSLTPNFQQAVGGEPRVPHRRDARLAVNLVLRFKQQLLNGIAGDGAVGIAFGMPSASYIITLFAMAGKIAPSPSSPFSRSVTKSTAFSIAMLRMSRGNNGSTTRNTLSMAEKVKNHDHF